MNTSIDSLKSAASEQTGLDDFGSGLYADPLQAWVTDLNSSNLNERGKEFFKGLVVADLSKRLKLVQCFKDYPEIGEVVVPPILYITGHERSGTTLLHNLLCLHPKSRAFLRWELMQPAPPPEASTYHSDPRIAQVQAPIDKLKGSLLEQLHWVNADEPEECAWGLWNCSGMLGQAVSFVAPNWFQWLHEADFTPTLEEYRCLVKLLLWRNPVPDNGFLVLKCPQFLWNLESFTRVFPEARFIFTHRDPYRVFTSTGYLVQHINTPFITDKAYFSNDGTGIQMVRSRCERRLKRMIELDQLLSGRIQHISYSELVSNPIETVESIFREFAVEKFDQLQNRIEDFIQRQWLGHRAKPAEHIPSFGWSHGDFLNLEIVALYCHYFGVRREVTRNTG